MASVGTLSLFFPVFLPASAGGLLYLANRARFVDWRAWLWDFVSGPGRTSRILLLLFVATNWKSMPFAWTARIFHSFLYQFGFHRHPDLPLQALFRYGVTSSRTSLLETDYNMHKSNSTYFSDLDVSRSHLVTRLLGPGMRRLAASANGKASTTPIAAPQPTTAATGSTAASGLVVRNLSGSQVFGPFGIGLGAVYCSFRREIAPIEKYEMWSRILAWDRKWLYTVTHFVAPAGKIRSGKDMKEEELAKYVVATAVSKYVFKLGRFTVHPSIVLGASEMLPARPGGEEAWRGGEAGVGVDEELGEQETEDWDWRKVEKQRRAGMEFAKHFAALDGVNGLFTGGQDETLGYFPVG